MEHNMNLNNPNQVDELNIDQNSISNQVSFNDNNDGDQINSTVEGGMDRSNVDNHQGEPQNHSEDTEANFNNIERPQLNRGFVHLFVTFRSSEAGGNDSDEPLGGVFRIFVPSSENREDTLTEILTQIAMRMSSQVDKKLYPASKEELDNMSSFLVDQTFIGKNKAQCTVCLEDWSEGEEISKMPCSHLYHKNCLTLWLEKSNTCPYCRFPLFTEDEDFNKQITRDIYTRSKNYTGGPIPQCSMASNGLCQCNLSCHVNTPMVELSCSHQFHPQCLETSLLSTNLVLSAASAFKCPSCRRNAMVKNWEQYTIPEGIILSSQNLLI